MDYSGAERRGEIIPAINGLKKRGMHVTGPLPADKLFFGGAGGFDLVVAMYKIRARASTGARAGDWRKGDRRPQGCSHFSRSRYGFRLLRRASRTKAV